jgi:hypothetical protein
MFPALLSLGGICATGLWQSRGLADVGVFEVALVALAVLVIGAVALLWAGALRARARRWLESADPVGWAGNAILNDFQHDRAVPGAGRHVGSTTNEVAPW